MSEHEEAVSDPRYDTPVPELDDHRKQLAAAPRQDRPRRGTFDSLYGAHLSVQDFAFSDRNGPVIRDFEEAVVDDETAPPSSPGPPARRPTLETMHGPLRSTSPPNSIKAFAEARRRERDLSFSEPRPERRVESRPEAWTNGRTDDKVGAALDNDGIARSISAASRRSGRSRPLAIDPDAASIETNRTAEEDVCFPLQPTHQRDKLHIDFDYLEHFINSDAIARNASRRDSESKVFEDLRQQPSRAPTQLTTVDGDIIEMPFDVSEKDDDPKPQTPMASAPQPDRICFFSSAWESTIHATELRGLTFGDESIRDLFVLPKDEIDGVWWLNLNNPTKEEVQGIAKAFGVHPLTIEDISTCESREKIELFPAYYFASFRSFNTVPDGDGVEYEPFNLYVIVFREGVISFSFDPNSHAARVRKRIGLLQDFVALSSDWICYALIDDIVDCFAPVIQRIEGEADAIEDAVFIIREDESSHTFLQSIGRVRKNVMALMRLLGGKADVLRGFTKRCNENYKVTPRMDIGLYLGDIQDHVVTMVTNLGHFEKILSRAHSNYLAQLSINSIFQSNDTNKVLSKITFLASVLVPLNLVCGLFGMNVPVPWAGSGSLVPFFVIIASLLVISVIIIVWARRMKYI